jgi:hypothetical protein
MMIDLNVYWLKKNLMFLTLDWQQTPRGLTLQFGLEKSGAYVGKVVKVTTMQNLSLVSKLHIKNSKLQVISEISIQSTS